MRRAGLMLAAAVLAAVLGAATASAHDAGHGQVRITPFSLPFTSPLAQSAGISYVTGDNGFTGGHIAFEGDRLYLGSFGEGMRIYDISEPERPQRIGEYLPGLRADAPPDAMRHGDREIAVLNGTRRTHAALPDQLRTDRTEWLDVTDPANPIVLHTFGPDQVDGESHNGDIVDERRIYLPSGGVGEQGLRIYDLRPLLEHEASECRDGEEDNPCAPAAIFRGNPAELWESSPHRRGREVGHAFTHTHDITIYTDLPTRGRKGRKRDIALLAEGGNYLGEGNTGSIFVIDITDPRDPVVLNRWLHESGPGHHPIRYFHEAQLLDGDQRVMLVADEDMHNGCGNAGGIAAVRLSDDLTGAQKLSEWFIPAGTPAPVCSVHVFTSEGDKVFVGAYNAGLQVVDYSDPTRPRQDSEYIPPGSTAWGAYHRDGLVYMGDMTRGLDVLRYEGGGGS
jgi:hypothetical protein